VHILNRHCERQFSPKRSGHNAALERLAHATTNKGYSPPSPLQALVSQRWSWLLSLRVQLLHPLWKMLIRQDLIVRPYFRIVLGNQATGRHVPQFIVDAKPSMHGLLFEGHTFSACLKRPVPDRQTTAGK